METAQAWYEDIQRRYEDGAAASIEAERLAEDYWSNYDSLHGALCDRWVTADTVKQLMILRQLLKPTHGRPPVSRIVLEGAVLMLLDGFEEQVMQHIVENEELF